MSNKAWQLIRPITALAFDCDGTLSAIEGIDELAKKSGVEDRVKALTEKAMSETGITPAIYQERLNLVKPSLNDVQFISGKYYQHRVADIEEVIAIFQRLHKSIYVISAGVLPAVLPFAQQLKIPSAHVFAVELYFTEDGKYHCYDDASPLIHNDGKASIVQQIKKEHDDIIYIGDGLNDLTVCKYVKRFIGYGGVFYRENIANASDFYITSPSMACLLPLTLTMDEYELLQGDEKLLYEKGVEQLKSKQRNSGKFEGNQSTGSTR